jgi:SAM-dependent methyltransferase
VSNTYTSGEYLEATGGSWHAEDSPWKAAQIMRIIDRNGMHPKLIREIGCGAGHILGELSKQLYLKDCQFEGYDISPQAIELCENVGVKNCRFFCRDLLDDTADSAQRSDILLVIDVFEHVRDYMGFVGKCRKIADYKIYHIPLDIHVSSVMRNAFIRSRYSTGHLHYFTAESAIATLKDTGHEIVDQFYTNGAFGVFKHHRSIKTAMANVPRWFCSKFSLPFTARIFWGYSLLVLAK